MQRVLSCLLVVLPPCAWAVASDYNYDINYYNDYELFDKGYQYDDHDAPPEYVSPYAGSYDDEMYGDFFEDHEEKTADCRIDPDGTPKFNGTAPCDIKLTGVDSQLANLTGGMDGLYKLWSCEGGRPLYKREEPATRLMWYSSHFLDWEVTNETLAHNVVDEDILLYGGSRREPRANLVPNWKVQSRLLKGYSGQEDYAPISLQLECADGSKQEAPKDFHSNFGKVPLISDEEYSQQLRRTYQNAAERSASKSGSHWGLILVLVALGVGIVLGLPYFNRLRNEGALDSILGTKIKHRA